jgi:hypothetical protein
MPDVETETGLVPATAPRSLASWSDGHAIQRVLDAFGIKRRLSDLSMAVWRGGHVAFDVVSADIDGIQTVDAAYQLSAEWLVPRLRTESFEPGLQSTTAVTYDGVWEKRTQRYTLRMGIDAGSAPGAIYLRGQGFNCLVPYIERDPEAVSRALDGALDEYTRAFLATVPTVREVRSLAREQLKRSQL